MSFVSKGVFHETFIKNGEVVNDVEMNSFQQGDNKRNQYLIKGRKNNVPFLITNIKGIKSKRRNVRHSKKRRTKNLRRK